MKLDLREENSEQGVQAGSARQSFNGLFPCWNVNIMVGKDGQEVGVDAEYDGCTGKLQGANGERADAEDSTTKSHFVIC